VRDGFWQRLVHGVRRVHERPRWSSFAGADWAEHIMQVPVTDRFHAKQGRSIGRWVLDADGQRLVVYLKRHYRLPRWLGWMATIHPSAGWSPAVQEWRHLEWARAGGMPVPEAVASGEYIGPWGRLQSFLAVEELTGMLPLHEAIPAAHRALDPASFSRWKLGLIAEMAGIVRALHSRRWFHKDLYFCHFYIAESDTRTLPDWHGRVRMIDFHRLGQHRWTWPIWQGKDLAQLLYSSAVEGVTPRDRLRFWKSYRLMRSSGLYARWLAWYVGMKARRYHRHNRGEGIPAREQDQEKEKE
jgi:Lipopolysaccharide kinase (Kdo/WaaP) family